MILKVSPFCSMNDYIFNSSTRMSFRSESLSDLVEDSRLTGYYVILPVTRFEINLDALDSSIENDACF